MTVPVMVGGKMPESSFFPLTFSSFLDVVIADFLDGGGGQSNKIRVATCLEDLCNCAEAM